MGNSITTHPGFGVGSPSSRDGEGEGGECFGVARSGGAPLLASIWWLRVGGRESWSSEHERCSVFGLVSGVILNLPAS